MKNLFLIIDENKNRGENVCFEGTLKDLQGILKKNRTTSLDIYLNDRLYGLERIKETIKNGLIVDLEEEIDNLIQKKEKIDVVTLLKNKIEEYDDDFFELKGILKFFEESFKIEVLNSVSKYADVAYLEQYEHLLNKNLTLLDLDKELINIAGEETNLFCYSLVEVLESNSFSFYLRELEGVTEYVNVIFNVLKYNKEDIKNSIIKITKVEII